MIEKIIGALRIGLLTSALTGCILHLPKYPPDWSPLHSVNAGTCADLAGSFENVGQLADQTRKIHLTQILFPKNKDVSTAAQTVEIESSGDALAAIAILPDGTTRRSVLEDTGKCSPRERYIKDPNSSGGVSNEGIVGVIHSSLEIFRAEDGSLVVRTTERDLVVAFFIPVGTDVKYWMRFAQKPPVMP
jgi:hypothetical protein